MQQEEAKRRAQKDGSDGEIYLPMLRAIYGHPASGPRFVKKVVRWLVENGFEAS